MAKIGKALGVVVLLLGLELAREWYVLRCMGFEPGRFVEWVKGGEDA